MPRRVSLPGASELFRPTGQMPEVGSEPVVAPEPEPAAVEQSQAPAVAAQPVAEGATAPSSRQTRTARATRSGVSGRVRHDEKITVYVSSDELLALEQARLTLRAQHGLAVDRGRIVRESIALVMADLAEHGDASALVRRLDEG